MSPWNLKISFIDDFFPFFSSQTWFEFIKLRKNRKNLQIIKLNYTLFPLIRNAAKSQLVAFLNIYSFFYWLCFLIFCFLQSPFLNISTIFHGRFLFFLPLEIKNRYRGTEWATMHIYEPNIWPNYQPKYNFPFFKGEWGTYARAFYKYRYYCFLS